MSYLCFGLPSQQINRVNTSGPMNSDEQKGLLRTLATDPYMRCKAWLVGGGGARHQSSAQPKPCGSRITILGTDGCPSAELVTPLLMKTSFIQEAHLQALKRFACDVT